MKNAIHLDNPLQLLEVYAAQPTLCQTGEWCCLHYGRVLLQDLAFGSQQILCFPWEMHLASRELAITIDGKRCFLWRDSFGPEALELAQAIATQDRQVIHQSWVCLQERVPVAKMEQLVEEALNWLQCYRPADLEWFLSAEFDWQIQAHADAIVAAVLEQDTAQLQQVMTAKVSSSLMLDLWHPHPAFADPARRLFLKAVAIATDRLLHQQPQLVRWLVAHAPAIPADIEQQLLVKLKLCEVLSGESHDGTADSSLSRRKRVHASYKKDAQSKSLAGLIQKAIAIVKDGEIMDFEFESTNNPELDAAMKKDLEKVKPHVQLPAGTKDGRVQVRIVFQ